MRVYDAVTYRRQNEVLETRRHDKNKTKIRYYVTPSNSSADWAVTATLVTDIARRPFPATITITTIITVRLNVTRQISEIPPESKYGDVIWCEHSRYSANRWIVDSRLAWIRRIHRRYTFRDPRFGVGSEDSDLLPPLRFFAVMFSK